MGTVSHTCSVWSGHGGSRGDHCSWPPGSTLGLQWVQLIAGTASSCHGDPLPWQLLMGIMQSCGPHVGFAPG